MYVRVRVARHLLQIRILIHHLDSHWFCQTNTPCIVARGLLLMRAWFIPVLTPIIVFLEYVWIHIHPCANTHTFKYTHIQTHKCRDRERTKRVNRERTKRVKWKLINQTPSCFSIKDTQHVFNSCIGLTLGWLARPCLQTNIHVSSYVCENFQICCKTGGVTWNSPCSPIP